MKRLAVISLLVLAGFCTTGIAQAQNRGVRANIPFDFVIAGKHLPAGEYQFLTQSNQAFLIRNINQPIAVLSMSLRTDSARPNSSYVVFNKYGDSYFLSEIHSSAIAVDAGFSQSKQEKQLRQQMAWLGPDQVLLALK